MKRMAFLVMTKLRIFGRKYLPNVVFKLKLLKLAHRPMAMHVVLNQANEFSFTMMVKTGGAEAVALKRLLSATHVAQTAKYFMTLDRQTMLKALAWHTLPVIAASLWKLVTKCLCNIVAMKMVALRH